MFDHPDVSFFVDRLVETYGAHDFQTPEHTLTNGPVKVYVSRFWVGDGTSAHLSVTFFGDKPTTSYAHVDKPYYHARDPFTGKADIVGDCRMLADCFFPSQKVRYIHPAIRTTEPLVVFDI